MIKYASIESLPTQVRDVWQSYRTTHIRQYSEALELRGIWEQTFGLLLDQYFLKALDSNLDVPRAADDALYQATQRLRLTQPIPPVVENTYPEHHRFPGHYYIPTQAWYGMTLPADPRLEALTLKERLALIENYPELLNEALNKAGAPTHRDLNKALAAQLPMCQLPDPVEWKGYVYMPATTEGLFKLSSSDRFYLAMIKLESTPYQKDFVANFSADLNRGNYSDFTKLCEAMRVPTHRSDRTEAPRDIWIRLQANRMQAHTRAVQERRDRL